MDYLAKLQGAIKEQRLNRVVIASCTPRTHEPLFKNSVKEAGLNPYLLEFVSIREQVSWVHMKEPEAATEKAKDLVKMGVAKAALLEEGEEIRLPVGRECLIIGGGVAGMNAAVAVAEQGFTWLIVGERTATGRAPEQCACHRGEHGNPGAEIAATRWPRSRPIATSRPGTDTHRCKATSATMGSHSAREAGLKQETLRVSTIIVATGMREREPEGLFQYGAHPQVITQLELEGRLKSNQLDGVR